MENKAKVIFGGNFILSMCMVILPLIVFTACGTQKKLSETESKTETVETSSTAKPTYKTDATSVQQKPQIVESTKFVR